MQTPKDGLHVDYPEVFRFLCYSTNLQKRIEYLFIEIIINAIWKLVRILLRICFSFFSILILIIII